MEGESKKGDYILPLSIIIAAVLISGSIIYLVGSKKIGTGDTGGNPAPSPTADLKLTSRDVVLGDANAPVTLIEYADYQCPFCGRFFSDAEKQIRDNYVKSGQVKMVYRNFQFLGPESTAAAGAAGCAADQNQFWAYHDALYTMKLGDEAKGGGENDGFYNHNLFMKIAGDLKLDTNAFGTCIDSNKYISQVQQDTAGGQSVGVNSTPTSFLNGQKILGAQPFSVFQAAIDQILGKK